jgi:hypothetical protein
MNLVVLLQQQQQKTVQNDRGFRDLRNESNMQNKIRTNYRDVGFLGSVVIKDLP